MITRGPTNHRCGKSHPKAKLTDEQVRRMRSLYEQGKGGYGALAKVFECGASTVRDICQYRTRWSA